MADLRPEEDEKGRILRDDWVRSSPEMNGCGIRSTVLHSSCRSHTTCLDQMSLCGTLEPLHAMPRRIVLRMLLRMSRDFLDHSF